jgi:hypothetical protein
MEVRMNERRSCHMRDALAKEETDDAIPSQWYGTGRHAGWLRRAIAVHT